MIVNPIFSLKSLPDLIRRSSTKIKEIELVGTLMKLLQEILEVGFGFLVTVFCGVVFWWNDETAALASPSVDSFDDIRHLLAVLNGPIYFVIVACSQINHDVLVAKEEHDGAWIIQFVHFVEIWNVQKETQWKTLAWPLHLTTVKCFSCISGEIRSNNSEFFL